MSELIIKTRELRKVYNKGKESECKALNGVDIEIGKGELTAIVGKSGSGKSTLSHILGGLDSYTAGDYEFCGKSLSKKGDMYISKVRNSQIGFIQQDYALINNFTVFENIATPLYISGTTHKEIKRAVYEVAEQLDIVDILHKKVRKLSGGQCQRTAIGRAIVAKPMVVMADEPTGALDTENTLNIIEVLKKLNNQGITVIISTHEQLIAKECRRVIELKDGVIISDEQKGGE